MAGLLIRGKVIFLFFFSFFTKHYLKPPFIPRQVRRLTYHLFTISKSLFFFTVINTEDSNASNERMHPTFPVPLISNRCCMQVFLMLMPLMSCCFSCWLVYACLHFPKHVSQGFWKGIAKFSDCCNFFLLYCFSPSFIYLVHGS